MNAPADNGGTTRIPAALPFLAMAALAIIGGGVLAAVMAHAPSRKILWAVAYLVLVAGVAQAVLGMGQALLAMRASSGPVRAIEWLAFNLGNAGVMGGTFLSSWSVVLVGTLLFVVALAMFLQATWVARRGWWIHTYRTLIVFIGGSSIVGLVLSVVLAKP